MSASESELESYARTRLGTVLRDKYTLDRVIGLGGMAVVYHATHRNQATFAVKMLHPELSIVGEVRTRFVKEGYAANSVKHPGVVLVVDDDVASDGAAFLVMELLDGQPCDALLERSPSGLPPPLAIVIIHQLLDVLAAAHPKGIVHRDLKPANLFITRERLKVLDFGIARFRDAVTNSATMSGMVLGTPAFMPPEQAMASSNEIDGQTDLWAAGATLFTMLSGRFVHEGENATQIMIKAATQPARSLATVAQHLPPPLIRFVDRSLSSAKSGRFPDAATMRVELERACFASYGEGPNPQLLARYATKVQAATVAMSPGNGPAPGPMGSNPAFPPAQGSDRTIPITDRAGSEPDLAVAVAASMRLAGSTTTGGTVDVARSSGGSVARGGSPLRWLLPVGAAVLLASGAGAAAFKWNVLRQDRAGGVPSGAASFALVSPAATAGAGDSSVGTAAVASTSASAATSAIVSILAPPDAKIEVDGRVVEARDGHIEIKGAIGSVHAVRLSSGPRELKTDIAITESGATPSRVDARGELAPPRAGGGHVAGPVQPAPSGAQAGVTVHPVPAPAGSRFTPAGL